MDKTLLVSLVSNQTIPNVQFIKELKNDNSFFLFITTDDMEKEEKTDNIIRACNLNADKVIKKIVNPFSIKDNYDRLDEILNYHNYDKLYVNVTGGTKIMSLSIYEYFRQYSSKIYYMTGTDNNMLQIHPKTSKVEVPITKLITLDEYIHSCGFIMKEGSVSEIPFEYTTDFLHNFIENGINLDLLSQLRILRKKGKKKVKIDEIQYVEDFIGKYNFPMNNKEELSRQEIKYITGDWFEEYIYHRLLDELKLSIDNIKTGISLTKNEISNEFDVIFLYNNKLYTIECKTSVINENSNILTETIYKADSLKNKLGFAKANIVTLSSKDTKEVRDAHIDRGKSININIICREDIVNCKSIKDLIC